MDIKNRINCLVSLGNVLANRDENLQKAMQMAYIKNNWFTLDNQEVMISALCSSFLNPKKLSNWLSKYDGANFEPSSPKTVGLIFAGNIPLVGFHDFMSVFLSGNKAQIKLSSKDETLFLHLLEELKKINPAINNYVQITERLQNFDAVIATGSDNSARYFHYYFKNVPNIIRKNRTSIAVLEGTETADELLDLGRDLFTYFGLGCRNVSHLFVPENYDITTLFPALESYSWMKDHHKYRNNFDYQLAIYLLNQTNIHANEFFVLQESPSLFTKLSVISYERYANADELQNRLSEEAESTQCIVGKDKKFLDLGQAQAPELWDYADGVDTLAFLTNL